MKQACDIMLQPPSSSRLQMPSAMSRSRCRVRRVLGLVELVASLDVVVEVGDEVASLTEQRREASRSRVRKQKFRFRTHDLAGPTRALRLQRGCFLLSLDCLLNWAESKPTCTRTGTLALLSEPDTFGLKNNIKKTTNIRKHAITPYCSTVGHRWAPLSSPWNPPSLLLHSTIYPYSHAQVVIAAGLFDGARLSYVKLATPPLWFYLGSGSI